MIVLSLAPTQRILPAWLFASLLTVLAFCTLSFFWLDKPSILWAHHTINGQLLETLKLITELGEAQVWLALSGGISLFGFFGAFLLKSNRPKVAQQFKQAALISGYVFLAIALPGIIVNVLKMLVGRYRPYYFVEQNLYGLAGFNPKQCMNGFPSGHSQAIFSVATAFGLLFQRQTIWVLGFTMAAFIALTRLLTLYHFPSDIVMGSYLGVAGAVIVYNLLQGFPFTRFTQ